MEDPTLPLHAMDPTGRFSDRAEAYARHRPSYPAGAIDAVLDGLGEPGRLVCADVGAGTGISSRLLAERGVRVIAVEPNEGMRAAATAHPRVEWWAGTAESTGLADGSVDLVLCAQAFHWFRHAEALGEFRRILRPVGRLALVWNQRDQRDPFTAGYTLAIREAGGEHPAEMRPFDEGVVTVEGRFRNLRRVDVANAQKVDLEGLLGRAMSASYVPKSGAGYERLVRELTELHAEHADVRGRVRLVYNTLVYLADVV
jgi:SAM-dependent methyltransferase